ncbi:MAG: class I SAM-dependent methyltransferase [Candidatus Lokiarchaeota archaeon]|nr:class I SAM-dependent methyltransferase [Candidatus Lokiarchaeota archaeon]
MYERNASRSGGALSLAYEKIVEDADVRRLTTSGKVLDVGCGPGRLALMIAEGSAKNDVTGVDYSPAMVSIASKKAREAGVADRLHFKEGDVLSLPFPSGTFDAVISSFSVHEWPSLEVAIDEVLRVLRVHGAALLFSAPASIAKEAYSQLKAQVGRFDALFMKMITGSCKATWKEIDSRLKSIGEKVNFSSTCISGFIQKLSIVKEVP